MKVQMAEEKQTTESPTVIIGATENGADVKSRSMKQYVIIAVSVVLALAIILTAILVGMHLYVEGLKDVVKFSYHRDGNTNEHVTSDLGKNIVQSHVVNPKYEMWVVNDFNRDIQVVKLKTSSGINCFVGALNRTNTPEPSKVVMPENHGSKNVTHYFNYVVSGTSIPDISFLSKTAGDACGGISSYWVYPEHQEVNGRLKRAADNGSCCCTCCCCHRCCCSSYRRK